MSDAFPRPPPIPPRPLRHRVRRRRLIDRLVRWAVSAGGVFVIALVGLIFAYLLWVVAPLFSSSRIDPSDTVAQLSAASVVQPVLIAADESGNWVLRLDQHGVLRILDARGNQADVRLQVSLPTGEQINAAEPGGPWGQYLLHLSDDSLLPISLSVQNNRQADGEQLSASIDYPFGKIPTRVTDAALTQVAYRVSSQGASIAVVSGPDVHLVRLRQQRNFLTGETQTNTSRSAFQASLRPDHIKLSSSRWLYLANRQGMLALYDLASTEPREVQRTQVVDQGSEISATALLAGGTSLLVASSQGIVSQWFPVRVSGDRFELSQARAFQLGTAPISVLLPEYRRRGFAAIDDAGNLYLVHSTAERVLARHSLGVQGPMLAALSPRATRLVTESAEQLQGLRISNEYPEVSLKSLWTKVWYENYPQPDFVWQSSSADDEFEPKFSLTPLAYGTLKAALYAMLFAVPLALAGALYTAQFMAPRMRRIVKPTIETMEAMPTVILGFMAGLWLAPLLEQHLLSTLTVLVLVPVGVLVFAFTWQQGANAWRQRLGEGWQAALLLPVVAFLIWVAIAIGDLIELQVFAGSFSAWLEQTHGISYDQRNAMVVGVAMGFAVIPTIFSIAEDAVFGVPRSLTHGSMALGASAWQTLLRVVLPTASPGIFSALMIGLGRAVGETMIVLMATGNTPIMNANLFEGMRTLSANIAIELPEAEVASTHYRVLFLCAFVLFLFTFLVNTGAELVRHRLRRKYSAL